MQLKLLSWNIWGGKYLNDVLEFLKNADADIIALQEVILESDTNTAEIIAKQLGYETRYAIEMPISSKWTGPEREQEEVLTFGNAILSKHKFINSTRHELSSGESRIAVAADIAIDNSILHVWSIHLKHLHVTENEPRVMQMHNGQADRIVSLVPREKTMVMGDFNATTESYSVKKIKSVLEDAERETTTPTWSVYPEGCGICNAKGVLYKFDYIFGSADLKPQKFIVHESKASDHLPVSAIVEI